MKIETKRKPIWIVMAVIAACGVLATLTVEAQPGNKKLIKHGWDKPSAEYVRDHIREMEQLPFDGITLKWPDGGGRAVFRPVPVDEAQLESFYSDLGSIEWDRFTDNFIEIITADYTDERLHWFSSEHWGAVEHNTRAMMQAVLAGRCIGIVFDPEDYGSAPWSYPKAAHHGDKTFAVYERQVRERGRQWMDMLQAAKPDVKVLFLFLPDAYPTMARRDEILPEYNYGLLPAFVNGMLEAAGPDVRLIDGDEAAYYYTDRNEFLDAFHHIRQRKLQWIDPSLHEKYTSQVRAGSSLYIDYLFPDRPRKQVGDYLTEPLRLEWLGHNTYWSLATSDRYVWVYSERMNWWNGQGVPDGAVDRVEAARIDLRDGTPPNDTFTGFMRVAKTTLQQQIADGTRRRTARIAKRSEGVEPPAIDGRLDDPIWLDTEPLRPFVSPAMYAPVNYKTTARVAYDDRAMYIAVECAEPNTDALRSWDDGHDDPNLWRGDVVEVFISDSEGGFPFRHFMVNPKAGYWDSMCTKVGGRPHEDLAFDPEWQRAAAVGAGAWFIEAAIPWASLGRSAPVPGEVLRANIGRHRHQGDNYSSMWSPSVKSFQEPDHFGEWVFGDNRASGMGTTR